MTVDPSKSAGKPARSFEPVLQTSEQVHRTMASRPVAADPVAQALERKIARNRWWLAIERLWPRLWLPLAVVLLFLLATLLGLWGMLDRQQHFVGLVIFGVALLAALIPALRLSWPTRDEALRRLERLSGMPHRPASAYADTVADRSHLGGASGQLWAAHRQRVASQVEQMKVRPPAPRVERHDPFATRAALVLAVAVAFLISGDAVRDRLAAAFFFGGPAAKPSMARLDVWLTPPSYTGQQPILLSDGGNVGSTGRLKAAQDEAIRVPEGSVLVVRSTGDGSATTRLAYTLPSGKRTDVARVGAEGPTEPVGTAVAASPGRGIAEFRHVVRESGLAEVVGPDGQVRQWTLDVIIDQPPTIVVTKAPGSTSRGALVLNYKVTDDYGVARADGSISLAKDIETKRLTLADGTVLGPMGEAPTVQLKLPKSASRKEITGNTRSEMAAHVWAGAAVNLTLVAKDQAGKTGTTGAIAMTMPERRFRQPLARAVVEQRRRLALSPGHYREVRFALDALTLAPDRFKMDGSVYLGLRSAYHRLKLTPSADAFKSVVDQLWAIALKIEDGDLSDVQRRLREAQEELSQALERDASDEELKELMDKLRQAMAEYMQQLAEQAERNPDQMALVPDGQQLRMRDLQQMLDELERQSRSGSKETAQQLLQDLQELMENLQAGRGMQPGPGQGQGQQMREMMDRFGDMITRQRRLLDETFRAQRGRQPGQHGDESEEQSEAGQSQRGERGKGRGRGQSEEQARSWEEQLSELEGEQGGLREELQRMLKQLREQGGEADRSLDEAVREMESAEDALGEQDPDSAAERQARALDQLRRGAQKMTEQMVRGHRQGRADGGQRDGERDPLGRQYSRDSQETDGAATKVPRDIDRQRARRILEELRRRLSDSTRPPSELDYIERLLRSN